VIRRLVFTLAVALACVSTSGGAPARKGQVIDIAYRSAALNGTVHAAVFLPDGYAASGKRYPVVYFLHGLPATTATYRGVGFLTGALEQLEVPAILVAPQGAKDDDTDPEYHDWGPGRRWETALARELPQKIDANFSTIPDRRGRAIVGLSAGGYGAVLLGLHHLDRFAVVESWSGYFHPTNPGGTAALDVGSREANRHASAHSFVPMLRRAFARRPTFFAFYVGSGDTRFRRENEQLDAELRAARVPHVFRIYPGAHERTVWAAHAREWLGLALGHLAPPH
jgi:S-formylglutathione hydrolase FrmB